MPSWEVNIFSQRLVSAISWRKWGTSPGSSAWALSNRQLSVAETSPGVWGTPWPAPWAMNEDEARAGGVLESPPGVAERAQGSCPRVRRPLDRAEAGQPAGPTRGWRAGTCMAGTRDA
jgi:hypothetical protein